MSPKVVLAGVCGGLVALSAGIAGAADLEVSVQGIQHDKGSVRLVLYAGSETFRKEEQALAVRSAPARAGDLQDSFPGLAPGRYALIVYHDENGNGGLDRFLGMIPTEGYGLSNNPEVSGPPQFEACAFEVADPGPVRQNVRLRY